MEQLVLRDPQDQKDKRDKKARDCVVSSTCGGAGQAVVKMLRLCTQVSAFEDSRELKCFLKKKKKISLHGS